MDRRQVLKAWAAVAALYTAGPGAGARGMGGCWPGAWQEPTAGSVVTYDERSVLLRGQRMLLACGEMHYPRSTRAMWPVLLERSRSLGLNTISTYVFWNVHEPSRGQFDFTGERDLGHFLDLCGQHGLSVFLRVGPYICAEWNYGGFPPYLRDEPGITIRTMNQPYMARVEAFFERLAPVVKPRLASNGGPVILVQVENEYANVAKRYGEAGQQYLRWIVELAQRVGLTGVPTTTCEGGAQGAIETSNGFIIPPERIAAVRASHPGTPLLWTELYPAWYRVWGGGIAPGRDVRGMAGGILDFVSRGGSGWSYYPWHGGSNFGRTSMYLQTTTYDFFAPLDEYGGITETGQYLGRLHAVLEEHKTVLLEGDRKESVTGDVRTVTWQHGGQQLTLVQQQEPEHSTDQHPVDRVHLRQMNLHAKLLGTHGEVLLDLDALRGTVAQSYMEREWKPVPGQEAAAAWQMWDEPMPADRHDAAIDSVEPTEQLLLTKDATDYCWYSTTLKGGPAGELVIPFGGDFFYVYVDGVLAATTKTPLDENRGHIVPDDPAHPQPMANVSEAGHQNGFRQVFALPAMPAGAHRLDLLCVALGMVKGDWQIAAPMNMERKGIWEGVTWNGSPVQHWRMRPGLVGEQRQLQLGGNVTDWQAAATASTARPLRWHRTQMQVPPSLLGGSAVFRLNATGLGKGMLWVNGRGVGRHWLIEAKSPAGTRSQQFYHVPADWLRATNQVVVLEEQGNSPVEVQLQVRV